MGNLKTIDEYIENYPMEIQNILFKIKKVIQTSAPMTNEKISWGMPTFYYKENVIHFAVAKNHIGIYPGSEAIDYFQKELKNYKTSKGAIQLPLTKPIPYDLIKKIVKYRIRTIDKDS